MTLFKEPFRRKGTHLFAFAGELFFVEVRIDRFHSHVHIQITKRLGKEGRIAELLYEHGALGSLVECPAGLVHFE